MKSCRHRCPSSSFPLPGGQDTEAVNGLFASPILAILLKALVLMTWLLDHCSLIIVILLPPLHLQEVKDSLSESTVHINLHYHNHYNVQDHSADVAAA